MKINDVLKEDGDTSGDYQKMLAFVNANRVGGVPDEQQIPLALFKEIQKQRQQNQALSAELSDAEKRINQALGAGELSKQELGMHRTELDRERAAGQKQQAAIGQMGQQYAEREKASAEQMKQLTGQLNAIKAKPGVDRKAAEELEDQIKQLSKNSVSADQISNLEAHIATVQDMQSVDDQVIKDLVAQVNAAQKATKELEKTKQSVGKDIEAQLAHFKDVEKSVASLRRELENLETGYTETDATVYDLENEMYQLKTMLGAKAAAGAKPTVPSQPTATPQAPAAQAPQPKAPAAQAANQSRYTPQQLELAKKLGLSGDLETDTPSFAVAESAFQRSIAWATGKKL